MKKYISLFLIVAGIAVGRAQTADSATESSANDTLAFAMNEMQSATQLTIDGAKPDSGLKTKSYPGAVSGNLRFCAFCKGGKFTFQIISADGRILQSGSGSTDTIISIDFSAYPPAEYFLSIETAEGIENTFSFIKFKELAMKSE